MGILVNKRTKLPELHDGDWSNQHYRGYWIKRNAFSGDMWVEKDGFVICRVPAHMSWAYARAEIDSLVGAA